MKFSRRGAVLLLLGLVILAGLPRLRLSTDLFGLLPPEAPGVRALRIWDRHFSGAHELTVTLAAGSATEAAEAARELAVGLRQDTNLVGRVNWQPVWREDPEHGAGFVAWQWLNQDPSQIAMLKLRLAATNLATVLEETRTALQFSMSPEDLARRAYDPLGLADLPGADSKLAAEYRQGDGFYASADGRFRMLQLRPPQSLHGFDEARRWLEGVKAEVQRLRERSNVKGPVTVRFTGGPAIAAETSRDMEEDMRGSVSGTALLVAGMFALVHRRIVPLLWMQALLALVLLLTLGLAGWLLGGLNVVSLGFASILLGLVDDYGLVLYQEMLAEPEASLDHIRAEHARPILASAGTTVAAFLLLNAGGVPGLAQLGTLVAMGTAIAAAVMLLLFLQPFLRRRRVTPIPTEPSAPNPEPDDSVITAFDTRWIRPATLLLAGLAIAVIAWRPPRFDISPAALRPTKSESYAALDELQHQLGRHGDQTWLVFHGDSDRALGDTLDRARPALQRLQDAGAIGHFEIPDLLWPRPVNWSANVATIRELAARRAELVGELETAGFQGGALEFATRILSEMSRLAELATPPPPPGLTGSWAWEQVAARDHEGLFALGLVQAVGNGSPTRLVRDVEAAIGGGVSAGSWEALGPGLREIAGGRALWLTLAMTALVGGALAITYRDGRAVILSLAALFFGGLMLWAFMAVAGWRWNLMNMLALPLLLGAGVDYAIHQQTALVRHGGDRVRVRRGTSRALWLGGLTTVAGFGSLAWSTNAGLAGLARVSAVGILCILATAQFLLPGWWAVWGRGDRDPGNGAQDAGRQPEPRPRPSRFYGPRLWALAVGLSRWMPATWMRGLASAATALYGRLDVRRFQVVADNLEPVVGERSQATARRVFREFGLKLADLWRFEAGRLATSEMIDLRGRAHLEQALATGRGVLLVTIHLGNWELGAMALTQFGRRLLVLTQAEPGDRFTERRQAARAAQGIDTLVVGDQPFAFVEVVRRLSDRGLVALLADRPSPPTAVPADFFGRGFAASRAPAELARATGCEVLPVIVVRVEGGYCAEVLPSMAYDRRALGSAEARGRFAGEILRAFEPAVRQHAGQWFHFVPVWPEASCAVGARRASEGAS